MSRPLPFIVIFLTIAAPCFAGEAKSKPLVTGLKNPESVAVGGNGKIYVSAIGEFGKEGDGEILVIEQGKATPFVKGLDDPKGLASYQQWLYVADNTRVLKIDAKGKMEVF